MLESTGSVIPFFESKILNGDKVPLTDPRMTRFIISPEQAVDLIFSALKYARGGEIFIPHLPAFKITDLIEILEEKHNLYCKTKDEIQKLLNVHWGVTYDCIGKDENERIFTVKPKLLGHTIEGLFK